MCRTTLIVTILFSLARPGGAELGRGPSERAIEGTDASWDHVAQRVIVSRQRPWEILRTTNFHIMHWDLKTARRVATAAERLRSRILASWAGDRTDTGWPEPAEIYLYPSLRWLIEMTGGGPKSGAASIRPSRLRPGAILSRRIDLAANDGQLLQGTLPHEITHLVLGQLLSGRVPLWANEGAATLADHPSKQRVYRRLIGVEQSGGRAFRARDLLALKAYPDPRYQGLFYAQSAAYVRLLLKKGTRLDFLNFLQLAERQGYPWALAQFYGISSYEVLERSVAASLLSAEHASSRRD
jgi:hypothetical protein